MSSTLNHLSAAAAAPSMVITVSSMSWSSLSKAAADIAAYSLPLLISFGSTEMTPSPAFAADGPHTCYIREARKENAYIISGVDYMTDESFDIDLNRYQAQAVVYYLKARYSEDTQDIKAYEYYMTKFRESLKRFKSARSHAPYVQQGFWGMRKW